MSIIRHIGFAQLHIYLDHEQKFHCWCCGMLTSRDSHGVKRLDDFLLADPEEVIQHLLDHQLYGDVIDQAMEQVKRPIQQWNVEARPSVLERG